MVFLVAILLCGYAYFTWRGLRRSRPHSHTKATLLLYFTTPAALFTLVRAAYTVVYAFDRSPKVSPTTGTFSVKFVLIFLVQLIAALCLVMGGIMTRLICDEDRELIGERRNVRMAPGEAYTMANYDQAEEHQPKAQGIV